MTRLSLVNVVLVLAGFGITAAVFPQLPQQVPIHWNASGVIDGWSGRGFSFLMPAVSAGILGLFFAIRLKHTSWPYVRDRMSLALITHFLLIQGAILAASLGQPWDMIRLISVSSGILFAVFGNFMGKIEQNGWVGIRTPWTLKDIEVWRRTHRLGGYLFLAAGLGSIALGGTFGTIWPLLVGIAVAAVVPVVMSYVWFQQLHPTR